MDRVPIRSDIRNVAIVAHVDHGKTTLVDAMLKQQGSFNEHHEMAERVMDSGDLEREKGITILAKNTAVRYTGPGAEDGITINIIDTPGHADFGGEVERGLSMVDAVVLLVDASEGPLPQTRFVLRKALEAKMPVILVVNKVDRADARIAEVVEEAYDLFMDLLPEDASEDALDFPVVYASARAGRASLTAPENATLPDEESLLPLFQTILEHVPAPEYTEGAPLQAHVTNLDSSPFLGRLALVRIKEGVLKKGQQVAWMRADGTTKQVKISELLITEALTRVPGESAGPGDIVAIAGIPEIMIGETLADVDNPVALPLITVDEPAISMTIGTNTSPLAGREKGTKVTARLVKDRLDSELVGNVSLRVLPQTALMPGKFKAEANSRSRSLLNRCAAKASSSPWASHK
jgi:GTP-binding protein TypA/BipA